MRSPLTQTIEAKFTTLEPLLDERARRLWAAVEARAIGRGGIIRVAEATGLSRGTIRAGLRELDTPDPADERRPPTGGRAEAVGRSRPGPAACPRSPGRSGDPWRPDVAAAVDVPECGQVGGGA